MSRQAKNPSNLSFLEIHKQERKEIKKRRAKQSYAPADQKKPAFAGLALSGGGIRSATFCLGFLQELHRLKLLRIFDYLSTVSGGGYLGGWWSAWLSRSEESMQDIEDNPFFSTEDIRHPVNLLIKISEAADPISQELLEHLEARKVDLPMLNQLKESGRLSELSQLLVYPLNQYILKRSKRSEKADTKEEAKANKRRALEFGWQARVRLVETFPYELRDIFPPEEKIEPNRPVPSEKFADGSLCAWRDPIHHLRLFANYLTPRKGMLSADTWRAISAITRNLTLTWLILLPLLIGVMLLGQAYFLLNWTTRSAYTGPGKVDLLTTALIQILIPVGVLLVWIVLMGIAWLLCNRDNSSSQDSTVQTTCLIALAVLIVYALASVDSLQVWFVQLYKVKHLVFTSFRYLKEPDKTSVLLLRLIIFWAIFTFGLMMVLWHWKLDNRSFPMADTETLSRWKREVRRSRFSRGQSKLLVLTTIVAAVLLLSWFSCFLAQDHFGTQDPSTSQIPWRIPVALVPLLSAIGGSIFTALRATPVANADRSIASEPRLISKIIFAATPPLVVCVLAVMAAWFSHWLLGFYMDACYTEFWRIRDFLKLASILAIGLCMGLALYEMHSMRFEVWPVRDSNGKLLFPTRKGAPANGAANGKSNREKWFKIFKGAVAPIFFLCLLAINITWAGQAVFRYISENRAETKELSLFLSACLGGFIAVLVLRRMIPRGRWKWRLFRQLNLVNSVAKAEKKQHVPMLRKLRFGSVLVGVVLSIALGVIGYLIGSLVHLSTSVEDEGKLLRAIVFTVVGLSGGLILFRLLITRRREKNGGNIIELHFWKDASGKNASRKDVSFGKRPEALWLVGSICIVLPIALITVAHYINWFGLAHPADPPMMVFPMFVGLLLLTMMWLRFLVIQKWLVNKKPLVPWSDGIIDWLCGGSQNRSAAYQLLAFVAVCLPPILDRAVSALSMNQSEAMSVLPINPRVSLIAFFVSLPLFGISVFQIPVKASVYEALKSTPRRTLHSPAFLWTLASFCIVWAFVAGLLFPGWLDHVSEMTSTGGFTRVLLPIASGCFLIAIFEFGWGERDNRRSLNLIAFAFTAIVFIFLIRLAGAGPEWQIVPGLLAIICVWVGALGWMVDPNAVSMHQFYKGRLVRAYLGASNVRRLLFGDKEITETVAGDDVPLRLVRNCDNGGPYHLINTTLNLVAGRDLSTAQRAASSFVLSPRYCGSARTKYCSTEHYMNGQLSLGTAVAASGAAVSPNMGAKKPTAALAMLMTLLNVRLGYWAPTPNRDGWNSSQPRLWPFYLVREFLSQTNDLSDYCYLTDGGHFDNTGLYSLIERGCRYVVVVDCGADPKPCFEDLGEAIRRCRIDFGTEIKLSLEPFIETNGKGHQCFAVGDIRFSREHLRSLNIKEPDVENSLKGVILYFRPAVIEGVTPDVLQYSLENLNFPQQPTTNQWFGEAQFESYRQLGKLCAKQAFDFDHVKKMGDSPTVSLDDIDQLFESVGKAEKKS